MNRMKLLVASLMVAALTACGPDPVPVVAQAPAQPVIVNQDSGFDGGSAALGAMAGYMMGKSNSQQQRTVVIDNRRNTGYGYNDYNRRKPSKVVIVKKTIIKKSISRRR